MLIIWTIRYMVSTGNCTTSIVAKRAFVAHASGSHRSFKTLFHSKNTFFFNLESTLLLSCVCLAFIKLIKTLIIWAIWYMKLYYKYHCQKSLRGSCLWVPSLFQNFIPFQKHFFSFHESTLPLSCDCLTLIQLIKC